MLIKSWRPAWVRTLWLGLLCFGLIVGIPVRAAGPFSETDVVLIHALHGENIGDGYGWVGAALLTVMMLDAVTRASFIGFPSAFLGMLLVGVTIAAAGASTSRMRPRAAALCERGPT